MTRTRWNSATWNPLRDFEALRHEMDRIFRDLGASGWDLPFSRTSFVPAFSARTYPMLNVSEDKDNIYVEALAPGLDPESLEISVLRDTLRIAGEKQSISENIKPEAYHRNERGAGRFVRTITLPVEVKSDAVGAAYTNGMLLITLPKQEAAKPKQIEVKVS